MDLAAVGGAGSAPECANPSKSQKGDGDANGTKMRGVKKDEHNEKRKYLMLLGISWVRVLALSSSAACIFFTISSGCWR